MASGVILDTEGLTKDFCGFVAVLDTDGRVRRGTTHTLIGPKGSGKMTCFHLLTKLLTITGGCNQSFGPGSGPVRWHGGGLQPDPGGAPGCR